MRHIAIIMAIASPKKKARAGTPIQNQPGSQRQAGRVYAGGTRLGSIREGTTPRTTGEEIPAS
jgi:hypothetical protein